MRLGPRRLFWKVYLHGVALLLVVSATVAAMAWIDRGRSPWHRLPERVASFVRGELAAQGPALQERLEALEDVLEADIGLYRRDGTLVAGAGEPPSPLPAAEAAALDQTLHKHRRGVRWVLAVPVDEGTYLQLSWRRQGRMLRFALSLVAILLVLAAVSVPLVRTVSRPLEAIAATARRIGEGDLAARTGVSRPGEVGELAQAVDEMAARLETLVARERALLADISHELRTPMARIRVALEMEAETSGSPALAGIEGDLAELEALVGDILEAARLDRGAADPLVLAGAPLDVKALADGAAERFATRHPGVELRVQVEEGAAGEGDVRLLRRVVDNLLDNAVKHGAPPVELTLASEPLRIDVLDRGPGVPADELAHVFEPFYRGDPSRDRRTGGVGLGLALCRRIVEAHGGAIEVAPREGGGARFTARLG